MTSARIARKMPPLSVDVDFTLAPGVTALFGPPAAGKTAILECIAGFARPDAGRILIDDAIVFDAAARVDLPPRRRASAFVPQGDSLLPHTTLRRNLLFAARRLPRLERTRRVAEATERFDLAAHAEARPRDIPPEGRLRGAVARALLSGPKLLLLDEGGFSEAVLRTVRETFAGPVLLATRDLDLCCAAASRLMLIEAGRIVQAGAPADVVDAPDSAAAARLLGIPNIFEATIAGLDPGRDSSRLEFDGFTLQAGYIPGHFRGDRVSVAAAPRRLCVHSGDIAIQINAVAARLVRVTRLAGAVRMEFERSIFADVAPEEYERLRDNKTWQVEFPPDALKVL
jgi:molybdate transport system ATP-binding protein